MDREIVRKNLVTVTPELRQNIKDLAGAVITMFTGVPEDVVAFQDAVELWKIIEEIEQGQVK